MNITVTLSAEEMQIARLAISIAKHLAQDEKKSADITGRYMADQVIDKYTDLEAKLSIMDADKAAKVREALSRHATMKGGE